MPRMIDISGKNFSSKEARVAEGESVYRGEGQSMYNRIWGVIKMGCKFPVEVEDGGVQLREPYGDHTSICGEEYDYKWAYYGDRGACAEHLPQILIESDMFLNYLEANGISLEDVTDFPLALHHMKAWQQRD